MIEYKDFAKIIKDKRESTGLYQKDVAKELAIKKTRYNRIENGVLEPSFIELQQIARFLNIDLEEVLKLKGPMPLHRSLYD